MLGSIIWSLSNLDSLLLEVCSIVARRVEGKVGVLIHPAPAPPANFNKFQPTRAHPTHKFQEFSRYYTRIASIAYPYLCLNRCLRLGELHLLHISTAPHPFYLYLVVFDASSHLSNIPSGSYSCLTDFTRALLRPQRVIFDEKIDVRSAGELHYQRGSRVRSKKIEFRFV